MLNKENEEHNLPSIEELAPYVHRELISQETILSMNTKFKKRDRQEFMLVGLKAQLQGKDKWYPNIMSRIFFLI